MSRAMRWAWVALFLLLAAGAVVTNMNSRRILVLHEGTADSASTNAFGRVVGAVLRQLSRLKLRHQYLAFDSSVCQRVLAQMQAFDPHAVIAEGAGARQCLDSQPRQASPVVAMPDTPAQVVDQGRHVAAWGKVLSDLAQPGQRLLVLYGSDPEGLLEYQLMTDAARVAGLHLQPLAENTVLEPSMLERSVRQLGADLVFVGRTLGRGRDSVGGLPQASWLRALRLATPQPILASRLESLELGADMVLLQAPEQRGEMLAQMALAGRGTALPSPTPPYEMAVGLQRDFVARQRDALPSFYVLSARLAGFLSGP